MRRKRTKRSARPRRAYCPPTSKGRSTPIKPGYISVYQEGMDDAVQDDSDHVLPPMQEGDRVKLLGVTPAQHFTEPPPRFSEAVSYTHLTLPTIYSV